jgi:hypothetical protein
VVTGCTFQPPVAAVLFWTSPWSVLPHLSMAREESLFPFHRRLATPPFSVENSGGSPLDIFEALAEEFRTATIDADLHFNVIQSLCGFGQWRYH